MIECAKDSGHDRQDLKGLIMAYARDNSPFGGAGPPMVAYRFEDSTAAVATALRVICNTDPRSMSIEPRKRETRFIGEPCITPVR
jgi:hypothetical protein